MTPRELLLLGLDKGPLTACPLGLGGKAVSIHGGIEAPWTALKEEALKAGFAPAIVSGHRNFDQQKEIWNAKARGERPIAGPDGRPMDFPPEDSRELLFAILRWSALPGASRHHTGCDIDVIDEKALPPGYRVQLTPSEAAPDGPSGPFHGWLDGLITQGRSFGFYRPYERDLGGVCGERWHLSYAPLSRPLETSYGLDFFLRFLTSPKAQGILLIAEAQKHAQEVYTRFIANTSPPPFSPRG